MQKKKERFRDHKEWLEHPLSKQLLEVVLPREESRVRTIMGFGACTHEEYQITAIQASTYAGIAEDIKDPDWFWDEEEEE